MDQDNRAVSGPHRSRLADAPSAALIDVAELAAAALGVETAIVSRRDPGGLALAVKHGSLADLIDCETLALFAGKAQGKRAVIINDARADAELRDHRTIASALGVPILAGPFGAVGALLVMSSTPRAWNDAEVEALGQFARVAAGLIGGDKAASAMDMARDGIGITDAEGVFSYMNHAHAAQFGYDDAAELIGKHWTVLYDEPNARRIAGEALPQLAASGVWTGEVVGRRRDASPVLQEITLSALPGDAIVCATRDVSERRALEEQTLRLTEMRARAEAASAAKSAFLAQMSHEIRTPLNGVIGLASALSKTPLNSSQREIVALLESCGETLEHLVADILDLSRIEAGKVEFAKAPFDLAAAVETATLLAGASAQTKGLNLTVRCEEGLRGRAFLGDAQRIKQLALNLVSNAVKFTQTGGVEVRLGAEALGGGQHIVKLEVQDTGIGFDPRDAQRLFQRFEQGDEFIARTYGGTGLGLSICQALAEGMGGEISCLSAPGAGSTFTVLLPLDPTQHPPSPAPDDIARAPCRGLRILVAEDHATNRRVMDIILTAAGARVRFVANGQEAVEARGAEDFDIVIMDMMMPVMGGLEAIAKVRELEQTQGLPRVRIAVLSANAMDSQRMLALAAGADVYLAKPITARSLLAGVEEAFSAAPGALVASARA
jgi:PAS domain S-box-containing protein